MPRNKHLSRSNGSRRRKAGKPSKTSSEIVRAVIGARTYPSEPHVRLNLPCDPILLTTTVTSGVIASNTNIDPTSLVRGWTTRFASTFDQYIVVGCRVRIRPINSASGVTRFWFNDSSNGPTTANASSERHALTLSNSQANSASVKTLSYMSKDFVDLSYAIMSSPPQSMFEFVVYTDAATWGAPTVATPLWLIEPEVVVEFRGLAST